jgi:hypothetical protein
MRRKSLLDRDFLPAGNQHHATTVRRELMRKLLTQATGGACDQRAVIE